MQSECWQVPLDHIFFIFTSISTGDTTQIDLLFDRRDDCINLCEIKFSFSEFIIDKKHAVALTQKRKGLLRENPNT